LPWEFIFILVFDVVNHCTFLHNKRQEGMYFQFRSSYFSFCVFLLGVFMFRVPCCDVCNDFHCIRRSLSIILQRKQHIICSFCNVSEIKLKQTTILVKNYHLLWIKTWDFPSPIFIYICTNPYPIGNIVQLRNNLFSHYCS
jgi:hypothetical protein